MPRDTFAFYRSFYEAILELDEKQQLEMYKVIIEYALNDTEPELTGFKSVVFKLIKPQIDSAAARYDRCVENGKKGAEFGKYGGRPTNKKPQENPKHNPNETPRKPLNENVNVNVNVNENVDDNVRCGFSISLSVLSSFISSHNYNVDAQKFYDYYNPRNWTDKNGKVVDWQKSLKMWHDNELKVVIKIAIDSLEIERSVIGSLLLFDTELSDKLDLLSEYDFTYSPLKKIFVAMKSEYVQNERYDCIIIGARLEDQDKIEMKTCMDTVITINVFDDHLKRLLELSRKRRIRFRIEKFIFDECDISDLQQIIDDESKNQNFVNSIEKSNKNIDDFVEHLNVKRPSIDTGFPMLDKVTGGFEKGTMFIIGARPSVGKTTFAINIASQQIKRKQKVLIFSLEMTARMIYEKISSADLQIKSGNFKNQNLSDEEVAKITAYMSYIKNDGNILVRDDVYAVETISNIIAEVKPDLVLVDYVQIVTTLNSYKNLREQIEYITAELKKSAKKNNCLLILLSQLSRTGKDAPTMSELKECGGLEANGDYIALLHRPYVQDKKNPDLTPEATSLLLDKNKFGPTCQIDMHFELKHQKFYEVDQIHVTNDLPFNQNDYEEIEV